MVPQPVVVGLTLCEKIIVEEGTKAISLISCLKKLNVDSFPTPPERLCLYVALTGGLGEGTMKLLVTRLETDQVIFSSKRSIQFADRLSMIRVMLRFRGLTFPEQGKYQCALWLDDEWMAQTGVELVANEEHP
jgi:hypothetical protein